MRISDGIVVGLCFGFSLSASQLLALLSAEETARHFNLDRKTGLEIIGYSLGWTVPFSVALWLFAWLLQGTDDRPGHGLQMTFVPLFAIVWVVMGIATIAGTGTKHVKIATGVDVLKRTQIRNALTGSAVGMVLAGIYIFGSHALRAN